EALAAKLKTLTQMTVFNDFEELDWRPIAVRIDEQEQERRRLQEGSDTLRTLAAKLSEIEEAIGALASRQKAGIAEQSKIDERLRVDREHLGITDGEIATDAHLRDAVVPRLDALRAEVLGD